MNKLQKKIVKDALTYYHILNDWQKEFINDLYYKDAAYTLSESQNRELNRIGSLVAEKT